MEDTVLLLTLIRRCVYQRESYTDSEPSSESHLLLPEMLAIPIPLGDAE